MKAIGEYWAETVLAQVLKAGYRSTGVNNQEGRRGDTGIIPEDGGWGQW